MGQWSSPSEQLFGRWLLEVQKGGPTAAAAVWGHCEFLRTKLGMPFPTQEGSNVFFRTVSGGHCHKQAEVMPP